MDPARFNKNAHTESDEASFADSIVAVAAFEFGGGAPMFGTRATRRRYQRRDATKRRRRRDGTRFVQTVGERGGDGERDDARVRQPRGGFFSGGVIGADAREFTSSSADFFAASASRSTTSSAFAQTACRRRTNVPTRASASARARVNDAARPIESERSAAEHVGHVRHVRHDEAAVPVSSPTIPDRFGPVRCTSRANARSRSSAASRPVGQGSPTPRRSGRVRRA